MVRPFHSGSQSADWDDINCVGCKKRGEDGSTTECELDAALLLAYFGTGEISVEVAKRIGYTPNAYVWDCPEKEE